MRIPEIFAVKYDDIHERTKITIPLLKRDMTLQREGFPESGYVVVIPEKHGYAFFDRIKEDIVVHRKDYFFDMIRQLEREDSGEIIGYKKILYLNKFYEHQEAIVKLRIPAEARRFMTFSECRCEFADVLEIRGYNKRSVDVGMSAWRYSFKYRTGERVYSKNDFGEKFFETASIRFSYGIFFYRTIPEAKAVKIM